MLAHKYVPWEVHGFYPLRTFYVEKFFWSPILVDCAAQKMIFSDAARNDNNMLRVAP